MYYNHAMQTVTALRLVNLNKQFYQTFGREFSSTRQRLQVGVVRVLDTLDGHESILDLGCGNGELVRDLMRRGHTGSYTGLDFSLSLLQTARHGWEDAPATFLQADLYSPGWDKLIEKNKPNHFDLVTAFAVLHHIPTAEIRLDLLNRIHDLLRPGGRFIHSEWQFLNSKRLQERIQPWSEIGLTEADVDPGDYLMDWRLGGRGLRYIHHFTEPELEDLANQSGFRIRHGFLSDGEKGSLGLYQVWEQA
jgi:tRNA (uracil-5-)-methyltransferase TRM9